MTRSGAENVPEQIHPEPLANQNFGLVHTDMDETDYLPDQIVYVTI